MLKHGWILICVGLLTSCASIPLTSLYKLYKFDIAETDPAQIRVAIRTLNTIELSDVSLDISLTNENNDVVRADKYLLETSVNQSLTAELLEDKGSNENVTVSQLNDDDVDRMRSLIQLFSKLKDKSDDNSVNIAVSLAGICKTAELPADSLVVDALIQTSFVSDYFYLVKNLELRKPRKELSGDLGQIQFCE